MITLLIDTHGNEINLRLYKEEQLLDFIVNSENQSHSEITMPALKELLERNALTPKEINKIIVVNGPGSFTGERLGVTISKTMAYALNIKICSITSLELYSKENLPNGTYFIKEKNGYYAADLNDTNYSNYRYLTKNEFLTNNETKNWHELKEEINDDYIIQNYFNKEPENPHAVNPFYVKKIEALKW